MSKLPSVLPHQQPLFQKLTTREQAFVTHPDVFADPVGAALAVGYAETTARAKSHQMRRELMFYIAPLHESRMAETGVTADRIKNELAAIAFANEADFYDVTDTDTGTVKFVRDITRLPEAMQRAIKKVNFVNTVLPSGEAVQEIESIELYDKLSALKELAEIFGLHDNKLRTPADTSEDEKVLEHMEPDELAEVVKVYSKAAERAKSVSDKKRDRKAIEGKVSGK